ncbi:MAG: hypothetical protein LC754_10365 [Acidobacteria bacterium]|nr:hypothetical protein [Acidobacteriota bacterium]
MKDPHKYINTYFPTVQDVADMAMHPAKFAQALIVAPQARLLDMNLQPIALPIPVNPADPSALCSLAGGGYVRDIQPEMNSTDDIHHKTSFKLYEFPGIGTFNTLKTIIAISTQYFFMGPNGPYLVNEVPVGKYMFSIPERELLDSGNFWTITGHGLTQIVADLGFENMYVLPLGSNLIEDAKAMLMMDYLPPTEGGREPSNAVGRTGNCANCPEPDGNGSGQGYAQQGFAVTDPNAQTLPYGASTVIRQRAATGFTAPVLYNATIGMKIAPTSGAPIDPWTCMPMAVQTIQPGAVGSSVPGEIVPGEMVLGMAGTSEAPFPAFMLSFLNQVGNQMYIDTATGKCYDAVTGEENDPKTGQVATVLVPRLFYQVLPLSFGVGGGDGGVAVAQGNGKGYSPSYGWSVADTRHALTAHAAPGSPYYTHWVPEAGHNVTFLYTANVTGVKIDAATGHPIDPWNNQPMPYGGLQGQAYPTYSGAPDLFIASQTYNGQNVWFQPSTATFVTWDGVNATGHLTTVYPAYNGVTPTAPATVFQQAGGDGGISTLPPGAIGPQTGPVGAYSWPDPNSPGLTPSGCPTSGPNIPAYRIIDKPSTLVVLDPDSGKRIAHDPKTTDTMPFSPKDNLLKAVNTVLSTALYWPLYDDADGNFILEPMPYTDGTTPQADPYFFYKTAKDGVIAPGISQQLLNQTSIANKVVVRSENSKRAAITAVAYNRSNGSYISVQNLGRVIQKQPAIQLDTITDPDVLKLRADVEVNLAALPAESIQMDVFLNPFLDVHDVIGMNVYSPDGKTLEISTNNNPFLVTAWKHDFNKRITTITLGRLVPI